MRAAAMFARGKTQAEVVRALGVSRPSVSRWYQAWRKGGAKGLAGAGRAGRRPRLSEAERRSLDRALLKGPLAHGFPTDLWTLKRIAIVIERITGVRYHGLEPPASCPPGGGAGRGGDCPLGEDPLAPGKKNARRRGAWIVFCDESGISLTPPVRRTWAPRGKTPVLRCPFNWKRASMAAALAYRPDGSAARLVFQIRPGAYNDAALIEFLAQLRRQLKGERVALLWDGLPSHRSKTMAAFIASQRSWLTVERLPAYAPELNPVEALWGNLKGQELANRPCDTLDEVVEATRAGVVRIRRRRSLAFAFLRQTGLRL